MARPGDTTNLDILATEFEGDGHAERKAHEHVDLDDIAALLMTQRDEKGNQLDLDTDTKIDLLREALSLILFRLHAVEVGNSSLG